MPGCPLKNSNALWAIFLLPNDLRSFISITRVLNELLIIPVAPIVAPPDPSNDEPACDRPSRDDHHPEVPDLRPFRLRALKNSKSVVVVRNHLDFSEKRIKSPSDSLICLTASSQ
jgi:hypothetical protein